MQLKISEKIKSLRKEKNPRSRRDEGLTALCKSLIEAARDDALKYDACRIPAETHKARKAGRQLSICKKAIETLAEDETGPDRTQSFYDRYGRDIAEQLQACPGQVPQPSAWP